jgi:broad specificity phosphatase PhoE
VHTRKIMVIRHAEKPNGEPGLMPDGTENPRALTATGWRRAEALVGFFARPSDPAIAVPGTIYASTSKSLRPQQTVAPLAADLGLAVLTFEKGAEDELVRAAVHAGGAVLIAWQHEAIPEIARLIRGGTRGVPERWPGDRFDLVWVFDRQDGDTWSFSQVPQQLMPGDIATPIGPEG